MKNEKENWTLSRALHPNRLKSKGQDIVIEKECPSCGANYVPDEKGCCSYCGYSLKVDNSKWKINASEKRNMSTIVWGGSHLQLIYIISVHIDFPLELLE